VSVPGGREVGGSAGAGAGVPSASSWRWGLMDSAHHVIKRISSPRFLDFIASYDVA
jgi:hypothetical protein